MVIDIVLESADYLKRWLKVLDETLHGAAQTEPGDPGPLLGRVRALLTGEAPSEPAAAPSPVEIAEHGLAMLAEAVSGGVEAAPEAPSDVSASSDRSTEAKPTETTPGGRGASGGSKKPGRAPDASARCRRAVASVRASGGRATSA